MADMTQSLHAASAGNLQLLFAVAVWRAKSTFGWTGSGASWPSLGLHKAVKVICNG